MPAARTPQGHNKRIDLIHYQFFVTAFVYIYGAGDEINVLNSPVSLVLQPVDHQPERDWPA